MSEIDAIKTRHSVRNYTDRKIEEDKVEALTALINECNVEGNLHLQFIADAGETFNRLLNKVMGLSSAPSLIACVGPEDDTVQERIGYYGERIVLAAQEMGLNTCWAGTFNKANVNAEVASGEKLYIVIAIGYGANQGKQHKSKSPSEVSSSVNSYAKAGAGRAFISGITSFKDDEDLRKLLDPVGRPGDPEYMPGLIERDAQGNYNYQFGIESDHLTEFSYDVGAYFNIPVSSRFAVGSKVLVGRSIMQELNLTANVKGGIINYSLDDNAHITKVDHLGTYDTTWDCFTMGGNNTFKVGTGISLTYAYKSNYAWKLFLDYDFSRKTYTMTYNPAGFLLEGLVPLKEVGFVLKDFEESQSIKKSHNTFILGGSFTINF